MSYFRFKQFSISNDLSALKVNTDGVLLGAAALLPVPTDDCLPELTQTNTNPLRVLDAGTGTGVIALMIAQRLAAAMPGEPAASSGFCVTGIDIDEAAAGEAATNFSHSPWAEHLTALHCDLKEFVPSAPFDLIVSNPPYFEASLTCPEERKTLAKHTAGEGMNFVDLLVFAQCHLAPGGHLSLILPADRETDLRRYAASYGLRPLRLLRIRTTPRKAPSRIIADFVRTKLLDVPSSIISPPTCSHNSCGSTDRLAPVEEELIIQDTIRYPDNKCGYTPEYLALTGDFYLD